MSEKLEDFVPESLKPVRRPFERRPDKAEGLDWGRVAGLLIVLGMVGLVVVVSSGGGEGGFVQVIIGLAVCFVGLAIYFLPAYVAAKRDHRNTVALISGSKPALSIKPTQVVDCRALSGFSAFFH